MKLKVYLYTILSILLITSSCGSKESIDSFEKESDEYRFIATQEHVANSRVNLLFCKSHFVIKQTVFLNISTKLMLYENKGSHYYIKPLFSKNDTFDLAIMHTDYDRIGHKIKSLKYYVGGDTCIPASIYEVYDSETECPELDFNTDNSNLDFLYENMTLQETQEYEDSLNSTQISIFGKIRFSKDYYPYSDEIVFTDTLSYYRKYTTGIPMKSEYFFNNAKLVFQMHEWKATGSICFNSIKKKDFIAIYSQLEEKIISMKGNPSIKKEKEASVISRTIWDNVNEHIELILDDRGKSYDIRLIHYYKATGTNNTYM